MDTKVLHIFSIVVISYSFCSINVLKDPVFKNELVVRNSIAVKLFKLLVYFSFSVFQKMYNNWTSGMTLQRPIWKRLVNVSLTPAVMSGDDDETLNTSAFWATLVTVYMY